MTCSKCTKVYKIVHGFDRVDKKSWFNLAGDSDVRLTHTTSDPILNFSFLMCSNLGLFPQTWGLKTENN